MHTCRKWRQIAFASQEALDIRLFCTHGTPVKKSLDCWSALPIVVQYGGLPALGSPTPEDEDNILAALKQSDRVVSISLTVTSSLLEKLSTIEGTFSQLQDLVLLSQDGLPLTLPSTFRCDKRLRRLHSTGIVFPTLLQPLNSNSLINLIDLQLHDSFRPWQFSPATLKIVLCQTTQLRSLSLHFFTTAYYDLPLPPYRERAVLPALTRLNYRGSITYLEGIVARLDAPFLENVEITLLDYPKLAHSKLNTLIDRIEMHTPHRGTHLLSSEATVLISSKRPGAFMCFKSQSLSKPSLMQISSMAQICLDHSPFKLNEKGYTHISTTRPSGRMDSSHGELIELLNPSTGEKLFHLHVNDWINSAHTFLSRPHENVLPPMDKLYIPQPGPCQVFLREAVASLMISRRLSGHPIEVEYERTCVIYEQRETGTVSDECKDHSFANLALSRTFFSEGDGRDAPRRPPSEYISSSYGCYSTCLAYPRVGVPEMATDRICITSRSKSSAILFTRNACLGDSKFMASPPCHRRVRWDSKSQSSGSRR